MKHSWDQELIYTKGDCRCSKCGMKFSTAVDSLMALEEWTEKEKKTEDYKSKYKHYSKCEGRR